MKARGAPATAIHVRDIVKQVYAFAILHGERLANPADDVKAASIATFVPKDRALSPAEIRLAFHQLETIASYPTIRLALRLILLTMVRKSELVEATWNEVDFENATWTVPKVRMKGRKPHVVYLSRQTMDIFVALHTCAAGSRFVLPSRYDPDRCMLHATLNRVTQLIGEPPRDFWRLQLPRGWSHDQASELLPEFRGRAIRMVLEHQYAHSSQWDAIESIAGKIGDELRLSGN